MIHHVSIAARDPEKVAKVLAELLGGYAGPFVGPFPGAWVVYQEDDFGSGIEVYQEQTGLVPGEGDAECGYMLADPAPQATAFHALVSTKKDRETIERIGAREGWRTRHYWRGPAGMKVFELYEVWIENRVLLEVATDEMLAGYKRIANGAAQQRLLAAKAAARTDL